MRFVLIHGGLHGAWCWFHVVAALEARGYPAIAIDLPGHGERLRERASPDAYADAVVDVLSSGDVLVGHSLGGLAITLAAVRSAPMLHRLIYLAAIVPENGKAVADALNTDDAGLGDMISPTPDGLGYQVTDADAARALFYHDCPQDVARAACARLTPQQFAPLVTPVHFSDQVLRQIPASYIRCMVDRCVATPIAELMAARLGIDPVLFNSSHSPFLSRPEDLAELLIELANLPANLPGAPYPPPAKDG